MIVTTVVFKGQRWLAEGFYNDDGEFIIVRLLKKL